MAIPEIDHDPLSQQTINAEDLERDIEEMEN